MTDAEYQAKYGWFDEDAHNGIKSKERVRKFAEVLTPRWMAEKMIVLITRIFIIADRFSLLL